MGRRNYFFYRRIPNNICWYSPLQEVKLRLSPNVYGLDSMTCFQRTEYRQGKIETLQWRKLANTVFTMWSNLTSLMKTWGYPVRQDVMCWESHFTSLVFFPNSVLVLSNSKPSLIREKSQLNPKWGTVYKISDQYF